MRRLLAAFSVAVAVASCGKVLGVDEYRVGPAGTRPSDASDCGDYASVDACGECLQASCCTELAACRRDATCGPWQACVAHCHADDPDCRGACASSQDGGALLSKTTAAMADLFTCKARACNPSCHAEYDAFGLFSQGCGACLNTACPTQQAAEKVDGGHAPSVEAAACLMRSDCLLHPNPACMQHCDSLWNGNIDATTQGLIACVGVGCQAECNLGNSLECAFGYNYPPGSPADVNVLVTHAFNLPAPGIPNVRVRGCAFWDGTCGTDFSVGEATTDDSGLALLHVANTTPLLEVYEASGDDAGTGLTNLMMPGIRLLESGHGLLLAPNLLGTGVGPASTAVGTGRISFLAFDCRGAIINNGVVTAEIEGKLTTPWWNSAASPFAPVAPGPTQGFFLDVPETGANLVLWKNGVQLTDKVPVRVRANVTTTVYLMPGPAPRPLPATPPPDAG